MDWSKLMAFVGKHPELVLDALEAHYMLCAAEAGGADTPAITEASKLDAQIIKSFMDDVRPVKGGR